MIKFIVDAQLPKSLSDFLKLKGFDAIHTLDLPERNNTKDEQNVSFANQEKRVVITKDSDFLESYLVRAEPHKLILIKTGNIQNKMLIEIFARHLDAIVHMISRSNLLEITQTEIAEHG